MALDILLLGVGFVLLYFGAEWLVRGAADLARSFGIPPIVIGLTVVAFGTSAPEFVVSLLSSIDGSSMIAVGNVFGSNICNIALVLGLAAAIQNITCDRIVVRRDIPIMLGITVLVLALSADGRLSRLEGAVLFVGLVGYTFLNYAFARRGSLEAVELPPGEAVQDRLLGMRDALAVLLACALIVGGAGLVGDRVRGLVAGGLALLAVVVLAAQEGLRLRATSRVLLGLLVVAGTYGVVLGADIVVDSARRIMAALGVGERFVGLTIVAFGTSLPELATSIVAALRKQMDISIGNLVGSNVFNLLGVLGLASFVRPIDIPGGFVASGMLFDGLVMLVTSALPLLFMWRATTVTRRDGLVLLACYAGFLAWLVASSA